MGDTNLGVTDNNAPLALDLERLIGSHACIVANSGGGKSGLLRRLLETTHGRVQHIVLDVEDEFYTLRERFDYVIAGGEGGDAPATLANAEGLALAALAHGFSLIVQLNDLGEDAPAFVGRFLKALIGAPRDLWRPLLVVIDEAHHFAPSEGSSDASAGVKALTGQGRKRGFTAVLASQRISKMNADVRGDINNWMLGRVGQTLDRNIMADQLGFTRKEGQERLRMEGRSFWAFGPAVAPEPVLFRVTDAETTIVKSGQAKIPTPPPPEAMRAILAGLVVEQAASADPNPPTANDSVRAAEVDRLRTELARAREASDRAYESGKVAGISIGITRARAAIDALRVDAPEPPLAAPIATREPRPARGKSTLGAAPAGVPAGCQKPLATLASVYPSGLTEPQWATAAGYKRSGGTWGTYKGRLRGAGLIDLRDGRWFATEAGASAAGDVELPPTPGPDLVRWWAAKLPGTPKIAEALIAAWPRAMTKSELAAAVGMSATGGSFGTYLGRLAGPGLIDRSNGIRLTSEVMS